MGTEQSKRSRGHVTLRQALREWRCKAVGHLAFYPEGAVIVPETGGRLGLQECQACGRFTVRVIPEGEQ